MTAIIILVVVIVLVAVWFVTIYNGIVTADNKCDNAWQTIDAQLQRRNDLIPNLVETVKGYAAHESGTLEAVTAARAAVASATTPEAKMDASNVLTGTLKSLFAVAEAYPDLKANENFAQLSAALVEVEDHLQYARRFYNGAVRDYNDAGQRFPAMLVARGFGFDAAEFFQAESDSRAAPKLELAP